MRETTSHSSMRLLLATFVLVASSGVVAQEHAVWRAWEGEKKLIVVTTPNWDSVEGKLVRYERRNGQRTKISEPIPVVLGKTGMAWDPALVRAEAARYPGPVKHEGDERSPAGVFQLKRGTFGFAPSFPGSRNYIALTPTVECVDDPDSRYYGKVVDRAYTRDPSFVPDWKSSEKMSSIPQYRWGVIVNYNMDQPVRGDGSCIFLHQWSGPTSGTAGCTAMAADNIEEIVRWVDGEVRAVLVQLPEPEYQRLRLHWQLP